MEEDSPDLVNSDGMPSTLVRRADEYYVVLAGDPRIKLARLAASVLHKVLRYPRYDDMDPVRFKGLMDMALIGLMTGWIVSLAGPESQEYGYAWTANHVKLRGYAETMVTDGLELQQILLLAARLWGGLPCTFTPLIRTDTTLVGITCPQVTILLDVLVRPTEVAKRGLQRGLFNLYRGSTPMIPREQLSGLIFAGDMPSRTPTVDINAMEQTPAEPQIDEEIIFTLELEKKDAGALAVILCGWIHGEPRFKLDPSVVLAGLLGERTLRRITKPHGTHRNRSACSHMSSPELIQYASGLKVRDGNVLVRAGTRADLQVLAAGCHLGLRTLMVIEEEDLSLVRTHTVQRGPKGRRTGVTLWLDLPYSQRQMNQTTSAVFIFCSDEFPTGLAEASRLADISDDSDSSD